MQHGPDQPGYPNHSFPGQFGPPPVPPVVPPPPSKPFSNIVLVILLGICALGLLFIIGGNREPVIFGFGISLLLGVLANVVIIDKQGFITLHGRIVWKRVQGKKKWFFWCLFIMFFPFLLTFYLAQYLFGSVKSPVPQMVPGYVPSRTRRTVPGCLAGIGVAIFCLLVTVMQAPAIKPGTNVASTDQHNKTPVVNAQTVSTPTLVSTSTPTPLPPTPTPTPIPPTPTPVPPTPTLEPTQPPVPEPTQPPAPEPTQPPAPEPTQPPVVTGVNGNPWGYDFNAGNLIYDPPATFCTYFNCIGNFWNGEGYVVQCGNGEYSKSGGRSGACSRNGGIASILYSH